MLEGMLLVASGDLSLDNPVVVFASVMVILLVAPLVFERLRIPGMIGLIAAGVVLGPHGARWFADDGTFRLLGTVGLLYLMFLAGLEINAADFKANRKGSLVFGALTFLIPMGVGTFLSRRIIDGFSWMQAILLASMFASHTLIPHPIAARLGLTRHRTVITTVGGTIFTDTAALLVLAMIAEITKTSLSAWFLVRQSLLLAFFVVLVLWGVPRLGYWFFRRMEPDGTSQFSFVVAVVFVASVGALLSGVEAIIGAFLAGIALSSLVPERGVLRSRLEFAGHALFIPFFLLRVGMLVNPAAFVAGWDVLRVAAFMCAAVVASKWLAAKASGLLLGYHADESWLMFGLSVNQAAATLAAVLVGRDIGLFDDAILNGTITMILLTCLIGPWITERHGRRVAAMQQRAEAAWKPHPDRVLAAVGSSSSAARVLDLAMLLAPGGKARIHALHVVQEGTGEEGEIAEADRVLAAAIVRGSAGGMEVEGVTRIAATTAQGIVRAARELRASVLVLGWAGRSAARLFLFRSLLDRVLASARGQTLVVGRWPHTVGTSRRVWAVVPPLVDRQDGLTDGLRVLCTVARRAGADLSVICMESGVPTVRSALARAADKLETTVSTCVRWEDVLPTLRREMGDGDLLALLSARRSQAGWDGVLERFPSVLARTFPEHNLLLVFPPVALEGMAASSAEESPDRGQLLRARLEQRCLETALLGWSGTLEEAVGTLLKRVLGANTASSTALRSALLRNEPVELLPGIVLLHTHATGVQEAFLLLAAGEILLSEQDPERVRIVLCLVSPFSDPPEQHLAILAELVRLVQRPELVAAVASATDAASLRAALDLKTAGLPKRSPA